MNSIFRVVFLVSFILSNPLGAMEQVEKSIRGITYSDIEQVWKKAPVTITNWAAQLIDPKEDLKEPPYRLYLHGIPGTGKTTLAYGIWKKVVDHDSSWKLISIAAGDLISKHRGEAAKKLNEKVGNIKNKKVIIVIDEAHIMMKNHAERSTDAEESTEAMQTLLNDNEDNRNCMICFTGNEVADMKDTMQSRISVGMVKIPAPTPGELHDMFHYHAEKAGFAPNSVSDDMLLQLYKEGNIKVGRDVKSFVAVLKEHIRDNGYRGALKNYQLNRAYLLQVTKQVYKKKMEDAGIGKKKLSDEERRHKETLEQHDKQHQESLKQQRELHEDSKTYQRVGIGVSAIGVVVGAANLAKDQESKSDEAENKKVEADKKDETEKITSPEESGSGIGSAIGSSILGAGVTIGKYWGLFSGKVFTLMSASGAGAGGAGAGAGTALTAGALVAGGAVIVVVGGVAYYIYQHNDQPAKDPSDSHDKKA